MVGANIESEVVSAGIESEVASADIESDQCATEAIRYVSFVN